MLQRYHFRLRRGRDCRAWRADGSRPDRVVPRAVRARPARERDDRRSAGKPSGRQSARGGRRRCGADSRRPQRNGLALRLPIAYNITMPDLGRVSRLGFLNPEARRSASDRRLPGALRIRCDSPSSSPAAERRKSAEDRDREMGRSGRESLSFRRADARHRRRRESRRSSKQMDQLARSGAAI